MGTSTDQLRLVGNRLELPAYSSWLLRFMGIASAAVFSFAVFVVSDGSISGAFATCSGVIALFEGAVAVRPIALMHDPTNHRLTLVRRFIGLPFNKVIDLKEYPVAAWCHEGRWEDHRTLKFVLRVGTGRRWKQKTILSAAYSEKYEHQRKALWELGSYPRELSQKFEQLTGVKTEPTVESFSGWT